MIREFIDYQEAIYATFHDLDESNRFKKFLGHTLSCDPLLSHFIIDKQLAFLKNAFTMIASQVPLDASHSVLEAGCGSGYKIERLQSAFNFKGYGCDISTNIITFASKHCDGPLFFLHDVHEPFNEKYRFNTIFTCMALQNIPDKAKVLRNIYNALDREGYFLLLEGCYDNPLTKKCFPADHLLSKDHYERLLRDSGFELIHTAKVLHIPITFALINFKFWRGQHFQINPYRNDFKLMTLKEKLCRLLVHFTIAWDRCYLRLDGKNKTLFAKHLYPLAEIGIVCKKI